MADVLVVDDDQSVATAFQNFLGFDGHDCRLASDADEAVRLIGERPPTVVLMDIKMPGTDGLKALDEIRRKFPDVFVVMMTGYGTSQTSIDAMRSGAFDYLTKPLDLQQIREVIKRALAAHESRRQASPVAAEPDGAARLIGNTPQMLEVYKTIGRLAAVEVPALVVGEEGTGKRLVVATIHESGARCDQPFVAIDCATWSEGAIESAVFGQENGTIHLANIDALPVALQHRIAAGLGEDRPRHTVGHRLRARVIGSTTADLTRSETFARELYAALALITLELPPLRTRRADIPLLVRHFITRFNAQFERTIAAMDDEVLALLDDYSWPGNVAELERVIKRGCILARGDVITRDDISESLSRRRLPGRRDLESALSVAAKTALQERLVDAPGGNASAYHDIIDIVETALVQEALSVTHGNQVKASAILGVNRATLRKKMPGDS